MNAPATTALGPVARAGGREARKLKISFEFSPPATPEAEEALWKAIRRLEPLKPEFVSVTYGAGGSTRDRTHRTVSRVLGETGMTAAPHLTCVNASRAEVDDVIQAYWDSGMRHIVALRGDPPGQIGGVYEPRADGYANATELTAGIKAIAPFEVSVGVHPQIHPESGSLQREIDVLKAKVDAGATRALSDFFFDIDGFLRFVEAVRAAGVTIPIVPGIMPVSNFAGLVRMCKPMQVPVPYWLANHFEGLDDDPATRRRASECEIVERPGLTPPDRRLARFVRGACKRDYSALRRRA